MSDRSAHDWLDRTQAITDAATKGPWEQDIDDGVMGLDVYTDTHSDWHQDRWDRQDAAIRTEGADDAEFIAHARTALPAAVAALRAVMKLHQPDDSERCTECIIGHDGDSFIAGELVYDAWPCLTVKAITETLGEP